MKKISSLLNKRKLAGKSMDQEGIFYVFKQIIKEEYGRQGTENIVPVFFRNKKIFVKLARTTWKSEIEFNRKMIVRKVNEQLGGEEVADLSTEN
jgi:hypothetical protein